MTLSFSPPVLGHAPARASPPDDPPESAPPHPATASAAMATDATAAARTRRLPFRVMANPSPRGPVTRPRDTAPRGLPAATITSAAGHLGSISQTAAA